MFNENERCVIVRAEEPMKFRFSTDVLVLDEENQMGLEFSNGGDHIQIRISGVCMTDKDKLYQMLDALVIYAREHGYKRLHYGDAISDDLLEMLMDYGFVGEKQVLADAYVLDFEIPEEVNTDECDRRDDGEAQTGCE